MFVKGGGPLKRRKIFPRKNFKNIIQKNVRQALGRVLEKKENGIVLHDQTLYAGSSSSYGTNSDVVVLNAMAEGTEQNTRVGRKITHAFLELEVSLYNNVGADFGFFSVVLDRQSNGTAAAYSDIYDIANYGATYVDAGSAFKNTLVYQDRFVVLKRQDFSIGCTGSSAGSIPLKMKINIPLSKLKASDAVAMYNSASAVTPNTGALYFTIATSGTGASLANPTYYNLNARYRFTDA